MSRRNSNKSLSTFLNPDEPNSNGAQGLPKGTQPFTPQGETEPCTFIRRGEHDTFYYLLPDNTWKEDKPPKGILIALAQKLCESASDPVTVMATITTVSLVYSLKIAKSVEKDPSTLLEQTKNLTL